MGEDQDVCCVLLQQQRPDKKYVQDMIVLHRYLQVIDDVQRPLLMASYVCTWQICTNKTHTRTYQHTFRLCLQILRPHLAQPRSLWPKATFISASVCVCTYVCRYVRDVVLYEGRTTRWYKHDTHEGHNNDWGCAKWGQRIGRQSLKGVGTCGCKLLACSFVSIAGMRVCFIMLS